MSLPGICQFLITILISLSKKLPVIGALIQLPCYGLNTIIASGEQCGGVGLKRNLSQVMLRILIKFKAWADCMPFLLRNPFYQWYHMELREFFGIDDLLLGPETAKIVYERCNSVLQGGGFSVRDILKKTRVDTLCTTNDPVEELRYHKILRN